MNSDELNLEMFEYILSKIIKRNAKDFKEIKDESEKFVKAKEMLQNEISLICVLPYVCKYVDKRTKQLRNSFKQKRAIGYYMYLQEKLDIPLEERYSEKAVEDLIDLVIRSGRFYFHYNINKLNVLKDLLGNFVRIGALTVPVIKFFK